MRPVSSRVPDQDGLHAVASPVAVREVACLGGCPDDGVVAPDGPGRARVRFTGLGPDDAAAVVRTARAHTTSASGVPAEREIQAEPADRLGSVTLTRGLVR